MSACRVSRALSASTRGSCSRSGDFAAHGSGLCQRSTDMNLMLCFGLLLIYTMTQAQGQLDVSNM